MANPEAQFYKVDIDGNIAGVIAKVATEHRLAFFYLKSDGSWNLHMDAFSLILDGDATATTIEEIMESDFLDEGVEVTTAGVLLDD